MGKLIQLLCISIAANINAGMLDIFRAIGNGRSPCEMLINYFAGDRQDQERLRLLDTFEGLDEIDNILQSTSRVQAAQALFAAAPRPNLMNNLMDRIFHELFRGNKYPDLVDFLRIELGKGGYSKELSAHVDLILKLLAFFSEHKDSDRQIVLEFALDIIKDCPACDMHFLYRTLYECKCFKEVKEEDRIISRLLLVIERFQEFRLPQKPDNLDPVVDKMYEQVKHRITTLEQEKKTWTHIIQNRLKNIAYDISVRREIMNEDWKLGLIAYGYVAFGQTLFSVLVWSLW